MTDTKTGAEKPDSVEPSEDWLDAAWRKGCANLPPPCEHEFGGWRDFDDGRGGEQFCQKCGLGAMNWSMWHV